MARTLLLTTRPSQVAAPPIGRGPRHLVIAVTAFLTVVDLFATQAILPSLAARYGVGAAAMGTAVNATTIGMALAGLGVALFGRRIERRSGIRTCLALLAIPTALLALAPDLASFTGLRIVQGLLMATAFGLTLAHLGERCSATDAASAFAAYVTGNVASNLLGRIVSAALADHLGLDANFYGFALLNVAGAVLVHITIAPAAAAHDGGRVMAEARAGWRAHLRDARLRAAFAIGFCILFAFIGTFTYVNFVLVKPPYALAPMTLGFVYLVFLPSIVTTPLAGRIVARVGTPPTMWLSLGLAALGLPLLLTEGLVPLLLGLAMIAVGTFLAQATATGYVGRAAARDRSAASGLYLASYFAGGLVGSALLGLVYERLGWTACVAGILASIVLAALLARRLDVVSQPR